jgi:hypothetical protein
MRRALAATLLVAALLAPASVRAAVVVAAPAKVGADAVSPRILLGPEGGTLLAWTGRGHAYGENPIGTEGVFLARRAAGAAYAQPERVAAGNAALIAFERGADGGLLLAWNETADPGDTHDDRSLLALAPSAALPFAAPEVIPLPAPTQNTETRAISAAVLGDGTVVIGMLESNYSGYGRAFTLERTVDGTYSAPKLLAEGVLRGPRFTLAGDRVVVWWTGIAPGAPARSGRRVWAADRTGAGGWTTPQAISTPDRDADNGAAEAFVVGIATGEMLAVWNSLADPDPNGSGFPGFPNAVEMARRPAGGSWAAPSAVSTPDTGGMRSTVSLSANGNAAIAWNGGPSIASAFAAPSDSFSTPELASAPGGEVQAMPIAVDDAGRSVLLRRDGMSQPPRFVVFGRDPATCFTLQAEPAPGVVVNDMTIAGRSDGTGTIAWSEPGDAGVHAADYRQDPGVPAPACPAPAAPVPSSPPSGQSASKAPTVAGPPPLAVGRVARSIRANDLIRRGLRVAVETGRAAGVEVALFGEPRRAGGALVVVAHRKLGTVAGKRVIRLKAKRGALTRSSRRKALTLVVVARDGAAESVVRRRVRARQG